MERLIEKCNRSNFDDFLSNKMTDNEPNNLHMVNKQKNEKTLPLHSVPVLEPVCLLVVIDHGKQSSRCETQSWQQCGECRILYYKYLLRSSIIGSRKVLPHIF